jgi:hypothetical protein
MLNAEEAVRRVTRLACRAQEEGLPLSPLLVLGVIEGRVNVEEKAAPLPRELPRRDVG